jgi:hypothetical protein
VSMTSSDPVLPAGTHTVDVFGSKSRKSIETPSGPPPGSAIRFVSKPGVLAATLAEGAGVSAADEATGGGTPIDDEGGAEGCVEVGCSLAPHATRETPRRATIAEARMREVSHAPEANATPGADERFARWLACA